MLSENFVSLAIHIDSEMYPLKKRQADRLILAHATKIVGEYDYYDGVNPFFSTKYDLEITTYDSRVLCDALRSECGLHSYYDAGDCYIHFMVGP